MWQLIGTLVLSGLTVAAAAYTVLVSRRARAAAARAAAASVRADAASALAAASAEVHAAAQRATPRSCEAQHAAEVGARAGASRVFVGNPAWARKAGLRVYEPIALRRVVHEHGYRWEPEEPGLDVDPGPDDELTHLRLYAAVVAAETGVRVLLFDQLTPGMYGMQVDGWSEAPYPLRELRTFLTGVWAGVLARDGRRADTADVGSDARSPAEPATTVGRPSEPCECCAGRGDDHSLLCRVRLERATSPAESEAPPQRHGVAW